MRDEIIEFIKQPPVIAALIALFGAAVIVPLVTKFYLATRNRLRVEIRPWRTKTSEVVKKIVREPLDAMQQYFAPTGMLVNATGYMTVTVTNISKKKITGVSAMNPNSDMDMVWQIDEAGEIINVKKGQLVAVGDIQPKHSRIIHIWTNVDTSEFNFSWFKRFLRISADELDSVRLRLPMPRYLWKKYDFRFIWTFLALLYSGLAISLYFGFIR
jgi:hypothetical protein